MISYAKGACWVKVLDNFVGRDTLKRGMQKYFSRFAHKNTFLKDMVNSINEAWNERASSSDDSQLDLIKWTDSWLMTQGPSTLLAEFDSQTKKLSIRQGFGNKYASEVYRE